MELALLSNFNCLPSRTGGRWVLAGIGLDAANAGDGKTPALCVQPGPTG